MKSIEIYSYNNNGYYIGESLAYESPLEKDVYILPKNSTQIKPQIKDGFIPKFNNDGWKQVPNYKGRQVYDITTKEMVIVDYFGNIRDGYTLEEPTNKYEEYIDGKWVMTTVSYNSLRKILIEKAYNERVLFFEKGVPYNNVTLHGGNQSAVDIKVLGIDLISAGAVVPVWKVKEGGNIENPTLEQLTEMLTAVATNVGIGYKAEDIVKQQIFVLSDEEISNFDVKNAFNNAVQLISSLQNDESASSIS
ncbi:hypothetical protein [Francisella philomiragia]|uniref:Uncharacterized protein n=1 Tax=Francisella philomiragia TaxID=28110 RepID=A0ABS1GC88_9GAMM|nr:hypothetical protein [Francisella philomiragia]MBK2258745.1 hypothetical protein [Francisella philomiragia]MBK2302436.1 hypothetical protein [Francisella philomiragia]